MIKYDIEKQFENNKVEFITAAFRDGEPMVWMMNSAETLAFNIWSYLTKAEPLFDEIRIRVATPEEIEAWDDADDISEFELPWRYEHED